MEVHAHTHTARKKWYHYFWEFLMLFLAVFCGFLAENIREHTVEQERAKQLARNLYKEIYADSIAIQQKIAIRNIKEEECVYFINYVKDSSLAILSPRFYPAYTWAFLQSAQLLFEPNDGILNQLRNSGELRYFKSSELQSTIGQLTVQIANVRNRNDKEYSFIEMNLRPFTIRHYDFNWYEELTGHGDLMLDTAYLNLTYRIKVTRALSIDSTLKYFKDDPDRKELTPEVWRMVTKNGGDRVFIDHSGTIDQLKNSDGMRLIRKRNIVDSIEAYYQQVARMDVQRALWLQYSNDWTHLSGQLLNASDRINRLKLDSNLQDGWEHDKTVSITDRTNIRINREYLNEFLNYLVIQRSFTTVTDMQTNRLLYDKASRLISLINKEYQLE